MTIIKYAGREFDTSMTLQDFMKSLKDDVDFIAYNDEFVLINQDPRLSQVCEQLNIPHFKV